MPKSLLKVYLKFWGCAYKVFLPVIESAIFIRISKVSMSFHQVKSHFKWNQILHGGFGAQSSYNANNGVQWFTCDTFWADPHVIYTGPLEAQKPRINTYFSLLIHGYLSTGAVKNKLLWKYYGSKERGLNKRFSLNKLVQLCPFILVFRQWMSIPNWEKTLRFNVNLGCRGVSKWQCVQHWLSLPDSLCSLASPRNVSLTVSYTQLILLTLVRIWLISPFIGP